MATCYDAGRNMSIGIASKVFADATQKPNNPAFSKNGKGHPHGCPFLFIALFCDSKTIAKPTP
jgi:hypothetical protein